jgi:transcriptional regulator with XRE-family HTH domain
VKRRRQPGREPLPEREKQICARLREMRERLGKTQEKLSAEVGITRQRLASYEEGRAPLRCDLALRICRQFIISEEWLATGRHDACHAECPKHGIKLGPGMEEMDEKIFFRQCVDLLSEPAALHISLGTLFGEAYDKVLAPEYARLVQTSFYLPLIALSDSDNTELVCNILDAINERFILLLGNEAVRRGQKRSSAWRVYARCLLESADLVLRKMMRFRIPPERLSDLDWLRHCVTDPDAIIPFLEDRRAADLADAAKIDLTESSEFRKVAGDMKLTLKSILDDVRRLTEPAGMKAKLAVALDVPQARVSEWLSGKHEPSGEMTLRIYNWVNDPKRQNK